MTPRTNLENKDVVLCECFVRDGLQHEEAFIETSQKERAIKHFAAMGFPRIEATSYSNPKVVPQFSDASRLLQSLPRKKDVWYKATCANVRAVERALADKEQGFGANEISVLISASESHSIKNLRRTRDEQWDNLRQMVALAGSNFRIIGTISVAFGCPFEGAVSDERIQKDVERFLELGITNVTLGDTTGFATPISVKQLVGKVIRPYGDSALNLIAHFHDSRGTGLVNCLAAFEAGIKYFDVSMGGVGGHPSKVKYGGGYTGNVCSEDLINLFESLGIHTGIDLNQLIETSQICEEILGRPLYSKVAKTGLNPLIPY